jgi:Tfp pilus assembly protein PilF
MPQLTFPFILQKAVELDDSYVRAHQRLANLYLRLGDFKEAKEHFQKAGAEGEEVAKQASLSSPVKERHLI